MTSGKIPIYTEAYSERREELVAFLKRNNVEVSNYHLPLQQAEYVGNQGEYPNALNFSRKCFILPCGTSQAIENVDRCINLICEWEAGL